MTEPLFEVPQPKTSPQECQLCDRVEVASNDGLRAMGWIVFDGISVTSKPLHVRVCWPCQKEA